jgi:hypothetical protein
MTENALEDRLALEIGDFSASDKTTAAAECEIEAQWRDDGPSFTMRVPLAHLGGGPDGEVQVQHATGWRVGAPTAHPDGPLAGQHWNEATKADGTKTHKVHSRAPDPRCGGRCAQRVAIPP